MNAMNPDIGTKTLPHESPEYIEKLFYAQIKRMSINAQRSFDFQFSASWM